MDQKKHYPSKYNNHPPANNSITHPFANPNKTRYTKGHQNQMINASRRTATYTKDKTTIVTENVNIVEFNSDSFEYVFGPGGNLKKRQDE